MIRGAAVTVLCSVTAAAQTTTSRGFDHFYNLEYDQAVADFQRAIEEKPQDASRYNHLAQALLYREMFKAGALESELVSGANPFLRRERLEPPPDIEKAFHTALQDAMTKAQAVIDQNPRDAMQTYALGVAYGLRGNWSFLVRKAYFDALRDLTSSRKLCNRALEIDPGFVDAKLVQGIHDYVVGSLPFHVRMLGFVAGFRGDKEAGVAELKEVAERGRFNDSDAKILLGVIYRRERKPKEAIALLDDLIPRFPRNYVFYLELAQMWSDAGDGKKALAAIDKVEELHRAGVNGYGSLVPEKIAYARGNIQFWYNDLGRAEPNLRSAASNAAALDLHTGTMAWLRLGQTYDLKSRRADAVEAYRKVLELAPTSEMARESKKYLSSPYKRDKG